MEWFDSRPERDVANAIDESDGVTCWVRLHIGELPILWSSAGQNYNPDFLVIESDRTHWVVDPRLRVRCGRGQGLVVGAEVARQLTAWLVDADPL